MKGCLFIVLYLAKKLETLKNPQDSKVTVSTMFINNFEGDIQIDDYYQFRTSAVSYGKASVLHLRQQFLMYSMARIRNLEIL